MTTYEERIRLAQERYDQMYDKKCPKCGGTMIKCDMDRPWPDYVHVEDTAWLKKVQGLKPPYRFYFCITDNSCHYRSEPIRRLENADRDIGEGEKR